MPEPTKEERRTVRTIINKYGEEAVVVAMEKSEIAALKKQMSKKGKLNLCKLLDQRRFEYGIPDGMWNRQLSNNKILVHQIPPAEAEGETFIEGGLVIMSENDKSREKEQASRGVLCNAGLAALDHLRSNGIDLGHIINFVKVAPYRQEIAKLEGRPIFAVLLHAGDITASEDLAAHLKSGKVKLKTRDRDGFMEHVYEDMDGKIWNPSDTFVGDDN